MKKLVFQTLLILTILFLTKIAIAQQPKAYEIVKYTARAQNMVFHLDYADGYIAASKISMTQAHHKKQLFTPENGTPETDGNFGLKSSADANQNEVILKQINEETEAPKTIHANYRANGRTIPFVFYRSKS